MKYKHCIFDLYGTLVDIHTNEHSFQLWEHISEFYRRDGALYHPEELRNAYFRLVNQMECAAAPQEGYDHEAHPEIRLERVFHRLYQDKGVEVEEEQVIRAALAFRAHSTEYLRLYPGAAELLRALRDQGLGVWLLSNAQSVFTRWELKTLGLDGLFDGVYLSSDYGVRKPDPRFFQVLLRERDINPACAVMVGNDGTADIEGARRVGLATIYIRSNLSPQEPLPRANHVLRSVDLGQVGNFILK